LIAESDSACKIDYI